MNLRVIITCVDYADFLQCVLPTARAAFEYLYVLTSPDDLQTKLVCESMGIAPFVTDVWRSCGAVFNKSGAITQCLQATTKVDEDCWVLLLDADILLPDRLRIDWSALDCSVLYSVPRRLCVNNSDWHRFQKGEVPWTSFPIENLLGIGNGRTTNPAGLLGYFQLWHLSAAAGIRVMPLSHNAAAYDVKFALRFAENRRAFLPFDVLHLGPTRVNWNGRRSIRWRSHLSRAGQ